MIIGLAGYPGSGKGEAAKLVRHNLGFNIYSFAEPLRRHMSIMNPIVGWFIAGDMAVDPVRYNDAIAKHGYDKAKTLYPEIRRMLDVYGTDIRRDLDGQMYWVRQAHRNILMTASATGVEDFVIDDMRFDDSELAYVKARVGLTIWIDREGCEPQEHRANDGSIRPKCDYMISNDGTLDDLWDNIKPLIQEYREMWGSFEDRLREVSEEKTEDFNRIVCEESGVDIREPEDDKCWS